MAASASLGTTEVDVEPGGETSLELRVRNVGPTLDEFSFAPIGLAQGWITVEPPSVSLRPGAEQFVHVQLRPPRAYTTVAGASPFAVKVVSHEDPESSVAVEATVNVAPFAERTVDLVPETARGRRAASFDLRVWNTGNAPAHLRLGAVDERNHLRFTISPPTLTVDPGTAQHARITAKPRSRFWRGDSRTWPVRILIDEPEHEPIAIEGAVLQEAMAPPWLGWTVLGVVAALVLAAIGWFGLVKPTIHDEVHDQLQAQLAPIVTALNAAGITLPPTTVKGGTVPPTVPPTTLPPSAYGDPVDFRLSASSPQFAVPAGTTLSVTDIVLENPDGNTGQISVTRDGQVLFTETLDNFRSLPIHSVAPFVFKPGSQVAVAINCTGPPGGQCTPAATMAGFTRKT
jgi:hypothetical protein